MDYGGSSGHSRNKKRENDDYFIQNSSVLNCINRMQNRDV